jgi:hypothetical protein
LINLLATEAMEPILVALGVPRHAPEQVVTEIERHPITGAIFSGNRHPLRQMTSPVSIVSLAGGELDLFLDIVGRPAVDALGDGEAGAIAVAVTRGLDLVIDDASCGSSSAKCAPIGPLTSCERSTCSLHLAAGSRRIVSRRRSALGACMCRVPDGRGHALSQCDRMGPPGRWSLDDD